MSLIRRRRWLTIEASYGAFYAAANMPIACTVTFLALWLRDRGLDERQIGLLMAAGAFPRLIANPLAGWIADSSGAPNGVLRFTAAMALMSSLLFLAADTVFTLVAAFLILMCFSVSIIPLGEALTIDRMRKGHLDYGRVRRWGSISIILMAIACGSIIDTFSVRVFPLILSISYSILVATIIFLPRGSSLGKERLKLSDLKRIPWKIFVCLVMSGGVVQATHAPFNTYASLYWVDNGISPFLVGVLWVLGISSEIAAFTFLSTLTKSIAPSRLIFIGACVATVRWTWLALDGSLASAVGVQLLHGLSLAATQTGVARYVAQNFDQNTTSTITNLYAMISTGVIQGALLFVCSSLYSGSSGTHFAFTACVALAAAVISAFLAHRFSAKACRD